MQKKIEKIKKNILCYTKIKMMGFSADKLKQVKKLRSK